MTIDKIYITGLRNVLRRFDEGAISATSGRWSIGKGGYDLFFELYYNPDGNGRGYPVVDCIWGTWDRKGTLEKICLSDEAFMKVAKVIMEEYDNDVVIKES